MEDKDLIVNTYYNGCWLSGDQRSQGISGHGIDLALLE